MIDEGKIRELFEANTDALSEKHPNGTLSIDKAVGVAQTLIRQAVEADRRGRSQSRLLEVASRLASSLVATSREFDPKECVEAARLLIEEVANDG